MMLFAIGIKHPLNVAVQCPHDANPREYRRSARRRDRDQRLHGRLPLVGLVLGLRKLGDVVAGVLESDELAPARQRYRIVETPFAHPRIVNRSQRETSRSDRLDSITFSVDVRGRYPASLPFGAKLLQSALSAWKSWKSAFLLLSERAVPFLQSLCMDA